MTICYFHNSPTDTVINTMLEILITQAQDTRYFFSLFTVCVCITIETMLAQILMLAKTKKVTCRTRLDVMISDPPPSTMSALQH